METLLFYILAISVTILATFAVTYVIVTLYINHKRKIAPKYHFTSPMEQHQMRRDYELKPTVQTGIDGTNAMNDFKKG